MEVLIGEIPDDVTIDELTINELIDVVADEFVVDVVDELTEEVSDVVTGKFMADLTDEPTDELTIGPMNSLKGILTVRSKDVLLRWQSDELTKGFSVDIIFDLLLERLNAPTLELISEFSDDLLLAL